MILCPTCHALDTWNIGTFSMQKADGTKIINPVNAADDIITVTIHPGGLVASICEFSD